MSTKPNRRKHPRVEARDVAGHLKHEGELQLGLGLENISLGGLLLRTSQPLNLGAQVWLELTRPGMKSLQLVGRVVSVHPLSQPGPRRGTHGLGVRFNPMGEALQERLQELVTSLTWAPRPSPVSLPTPVRSALASRAPAGPRSADFDYEFESHGGLAESDLSEAVVGRAASAGAQFDPSVRHAEFDFDFQEPLATSVQEPLPVPVPASAKLTARLRSEDASPDELRAMLEEREHELQRLRVELAKKNEQLDKLRRAVLELRHRNKPVL